MAVVYMSYVFAGKHAVESPETLVDAITALLVAERERLGAEYEYAGVDPGNTHTEYVWEQTRSKSTQIRLVDDFQDGGKYITVGALDEAGCERLREVLASAFSFYTVPELTEKARGSTAADVGWITLMAHSTNRRFDPDVKDVIEMHLRSTSSACRRQAAVAVGLVRWPQLLPALGAAPQSERDRGIRTALDFGIMLCEQEASLGTQ